jgi:MscS family membrane protein
VSNGAPRAAAFSLVRSGFRTLAGFVLAFCWLVAAHSGPGWSQEDTGDALGRATPRGAVRGYLEAARSGDYTRAARYLDLSPIQTNAVSRGPRWARQLKVVLDRTLWVDLESLSEAADGHPDDGLPKNRDRVGQILVDGIATDIWVDRSRTKSGDSIWRFASPTVAHIPELYERFGDGPFADRFPDPLVDWSLFEVRLWQWIAILFLVVASFLLGWLLAVVIVRTLRPLAARSRTTLDDRLLEIIISPIRLLMTGGIFALSIRWLYLALPAYEFLHGIVATLVILGFVWLLFRVVDLFTGALEGRFRGSGQDMATHFLPLSAKILKGSLAVIAILGALGSFGFDVTALIAGLGVGGLAVALGAQKTVENVFGGIALLLDQPVRPGDFCRFGDKVGTVEEIGIRSTRLRTLERTLISVPNSEFASLQLENFAKRDRILIRTTLGLRYETTADQLRFVMIELRQMLYAHPRIGRSTNRVRLIGFGSSSVDLELYCYVETRDWEDYLAVREDLFLRIIDIVSASGTGFAFPSQTAYLAKDSGNDPEKTLAAEARIAELRAAGELPLSE